MVEAKSQLQIERELLEGEQQEAKNTIRVVPVCLFFVFLIVISGSFLLNGISYVVKNYSVLSIHEYCFIATVV
ncbi:MAG: hypothetical protein V1707_01860, partial [bacterium]